MQSKPKGSFLGPWIGSDQRKGHRGANRLSGGRVRRRTRAVWTPGETCGWHGFFLSVWQLQAIPVLLLPLITQMLYLFFSAFYAFIPENLYLIHSTAPAGSALMKLIIFLRLWGGSWRHWKIKQRWVCVNFTGIALKLLYRFEIIPNGQLNRCQLRCQCETDMLSSIFPQLLD